MDKLKFLVEKQFIKKECDMSAENVIAALITASSKMARLSEIVSEEETIRTLLDAYEVGDNETVMNLIGMSPQYVKPAIGYSVNFNDYGSAMSAYQADKKGYDDVYKAVRTKALTENIEEKTM